MDSTSNEVMSYFLMELNQLQIAYFGRINMSLNVYDEGGDHVIDAFLHGKPVPASCTLHSSRPLKENGDKIKEFVSYVKAKYE